MPHNLHFELLTTRDALQSLEVEWNYLLERSSRPSFFLTWEFVSTFLAHFPDAGKLRIVLARNTDGKLVGAAPMMISPGRRGVRKRLRHLTFIGCLTDVCPENQDLIIEQGLEGQITEPLWNAVFEYAKQEWDVLHLPFCSPEATATATFGTNRLKPLHLQNTHHSVYVELPTTWESYLASLDTSFRKKLLKRWRLLEAAGEMTVLEAGKDVSIDQAMKELARLNQERFESGSTAFGGEEMLTFHTNLAKLLHARGMICLLLLRHKGETIGAGYEFLHAKKAFSYQAGWDSRFAQYGLGHIMTALCMKWCIDRGVQEYDFLCGEPEYKRCWSAKSRVMLDFEELNAQTFRGQAFKLVKGWQKRWSGRKAGLLGPARTLPLPADP